MGQTMGRASEFADTFLTLSTSENDKTRYETNSDVASTSSSASPSSSVGLPQALLNDPAEEAAEPSSLFRIKPLSEVVMPTEHSAETEIYEYVVPATTNFADHEGGEPGEVVRFRGLKQLLATADFPKSGDRRLVPEHLNNDVAREAARALLSKMTLRHLYERPLPRPDDNVARANYATLDLEAFAKVADLTVGELKDRLLAQGRDAVPAHALTGPMAAAVAKLMDIHELIFVSKKLGANRTRARCVLGTPGSLSSRLQPNHQVDDPDGIALLTYTGLSMAQGDCLLGLNPAVDTVPNICRALRTLDGIRSKLEVPTQICVLSHIRTQMACLEEGAPVEVMFQSIAGTDCCMTEFDIDVDLLDQAYEIMAAHGHLKDPTANFMYFETGQGSASSLNAEEGVDMLTLEASAYGLARRYRPFMVNSVTGFIGPETHRTSQELVVSALQDNFCGKLMGVPMGMDPCWTLHSEISLEAQQMTTELLSAAGTEFFMDVYLGVDRMLGYFTTSGHDVQTLREVHGLKPQKAYLRWAEKHGILTADGRRGPNFGNPRVFVKDDAEWQRMLKATPCAYGFENAGPRPANAVARAARLGIALSRRSVRNELDVNALVPFLGPQYRVLQTLAHDKDSHLFDNKLGTRLTPEDLEVLRKSEGHVGADVQVIVSDGLSADAIQYNIPILLPLLYSEMDRYGMKYAAGGPLVTRYARVKLAECVAEATGAKLVINLIGERPGGDASSSRSMSAYMAFRVSANRYEYTVINSIYPESGMPPDVAAKRIAATAHFILEFSAAGNRLIKILSDEGLTITTTTTTPSTSALL